MFQRCIIPPEKSFPFTISILVKYWLIRIFHSQFKKLYSKPVENLLFLDYSRRIFTIYSILLLTRHHSRNIAFLKAAIRNNFSYCFKFIENSFFKRLRPSRETSLYLIPLLKQTINSLQPYSYLYLDPLITLILEHYYSGK